jgi:hypothetical protein
MVTSLKGLYPVYNSEITLQVEIVANYVTRKGIYVFKFDVFHPEVFTEYIG